MKLPFQPIALPPGVNREGTRYQVAGRWYDANQVRWVDGIMQPIGGWSAITTEPLAHPARGMLAWRTNSAARWYAVGTSTQLIVGDGSSSTWDITPVGFTAGGDNALEQLGYGGSTFGTGAFGVARPGGTFTPPMTWQLDAWGEDLVACATGDGKLYQWTLATGTPAAVITNAPTNNAGLIVTDQRHLMALGAGGNGKLLQWTDVEDNTVWTPLTTNEAGQIPLVTNGTILRGVRVRGQILVLTNVDAHQVTYIGQPLIFSRQRIGDQCGLIGPNAVVVAGDVAYWMSDKRFWFYDGSAVQELPCEVADYIFNGGMNVEQGYKVAASSNGLYEEVTWDYCSPGVSEPDRYVSYNYRNGYWMIGSLGRTARIDKGAFPSPMAVGTDGLIYNHEVGTLANGASRVGVVYAETGALETGNGDRITDVQQIITDEKTLGDTRLSFRTRFVPNGVEYDWGPFDTRTDGYIDARFTGRQVVMRVDQYTDNAWQLGKMRWDARATSGR